MKLVRNLILYLVFVNLNLQFVASRTTIAFYDEMYSCDEFCSKNECFNIFDLSKIKIILDEEDYTVAYLNGTAQVNVVMESPQPAVIWTEKRYGTKWATEAFYHRYQDACKQLNSPLDPAYAFFNGKINCPMQKGETVEWKMHKLRLPSVIPPNFIGEWRILFTTQTNVEGMTKNQCIYVRGDVYET